MEGGGERAEEEEAGEGEGDSAEEGEGGSEGSAGLCTAVAGARFDHLQNAGLIRAPARRLWR